MKHLFIFLSFLSLLASCNSKQTATNNGAKSDSSQQKKGNLNIEAIKKQIALQIGMENNDVSENQVHFLDQKDIELSLSVIEEGLIKTGYKTPAKEEFEKKIKKIYNCENSDNAEWKGTSLGSNMTPESWLTGPKFINYYSDRYGQTERKDYRMVAFGKYNFIFDLVFLRNLVNIQPNGQYKITLPQNIIARNGYFFNGNKADLDYLIHKDKFFLQSLVDAFGYDKEPEINGVALSDYNTGTKEDESIGTIVFADYGEHGKLKIRKGLLKYIYDHTNENNNNMAKGLSNFVFKYSDLNNYSKISFEDKCEMLGYAGTLEQQLRDKYLGKGSAIWNPNALLTNFKIQWPKFIDEIKKQNYYNDPDIKKAVAAAEDEAVFVLRKPDSE